MKLSDVITILLFIGLCMAVTGIAMGEEYVPTGQDKVCNDVGYLSTSCQSAKMVDMKYTDVEVAKAEAASTKNTESNVTYIINQAAKESKEKDDIVITSYYSND